METLNPFPSQRKLLKIKGGDDYAFYVIISFSIGGVMNKKKNKIKKIAEYIYTFNEEDDSIDQNVVDGIEEALNEVKLMREGKLPKISMKEFLKELEEEE